MTRHNSVPSVPTACLDQSCVWGQEVVQLFNDPAGLGCLGVTSAKCPPFLPLESAWLGVPELLCKCTSCVVLSTTGRSHRSDACLPFSFMLAEPRIIWGDMQSKQRLQFFSPSVKLCYNYLHQLPNVSLGAPSTARLLISF